MTSERERLVVARVEHQVAWYDGKAASAQRWYTRLKLVQLVLAASIPVAAAADAHRVVLAVLGGLVVVAEGLQQLKHFHENWLQYRGTCEALRQELHLFRAQAGPYRASDDAIALLAERSERLMSDERTAWRETVHQQPHTSG